MLRKIVGANTLIGFHGLLMGHSDQIAVDTANAAFWNELCGSTAARAWGVTDPSMQSLRRYDCNYLKFYPYLDRHIPWAGLRGKRVLEIGLGYGTVSQKLAESGALFTGLDIAANPVAMVNHRLHQSGLPGEAFQGNILTPPFADGSFDAIVAIGCLHHTGDHGRRDHSLPPPARTRRSPYRDGVLRLLVSPALERSRADDPLLDARAARAFGYEPRRKNLRFRSRARWRARAIHRVCFDTNRYGSLCSGFVDFRARTENASQEAPFVLLTRDQLLASPLPRLFGLDLYWTCVKSN